MKNTEIVSNMGNKKNSSKKMGGLLPNHWVQQKVKKTYLYKV